MNKEKPKLKHKMYCAKSNMRCLVDHLGETCPDVTDCEACKEDKPKNVCNFC